MALPAQRCIKRAEMSAYLKHLRHALPPMQPVTDHLAIVRGIQRGLAWCTDARRPHADVWRLIWDAWEDLGGHEAGTAPPH